MTETASIETVEYAGDTDEGILQTEDKPSYVIDEINLGDETDLGDLELEETVPIELKSASRTSPQPRTSPHRPPSRKPPEAKDQMKKDITEASEAQRHGRRPAVHVDGEFLYCVEGDLLFDADELDLYQETQKALQAQREAARFVENSGFGDAELKQFGTQTSSLVGILYGGKLVRWAPGTVLRYCVLRRTFPRDDWYEEIVANMQLATDDWSASCGVSFEHVDSADNSDLLRPPEVHFPVRHISASGAFIAAAFFPTDPVHRRRMLIDPSYFNTKFDRVGVLRHELGHSLGFRHEHIRSGAPAVCPDEDTTGTVDLTAYDPKSVMHYFCGNVGSRSLAITDLDRTGAQLVYGPPLSSFELFKL